MLTVTILRHNLFFCTGKNPCKVLVPATPILAYINKCWEG